MSPGGEGSVIRDIYAVFMPICYKLPYHDRPFSPKGMVEERDASDLSRDSEQIRTIEVGLTKLVRDIFHLPQSFEGIASEEDTNADA
jgi:hypothetical protein